MDASTITTIQKLESSIGKMPPTIALKVIDHVDGGASDWIGATSLAFLGFNNSGGLVATIAGGDPGFLTATENFLHLPLSAIDEVGQTDVGSGFGSLLILPQTGEMLRINGRVESLDSVSLSVHVDECYIHCAKALIRSDFWSPRAAGQFSSDPGQAINDCNFLALVTANNRGDVDVSPKGDPAGLLAKVCDNTIWLAERPGNRRADSFKNMLDQPNVAGLFLRPGSTEVARFSGTAQPTIDPVREDLQVHGKVPSIATRIAYSNIGIRYSEALGRSEIWQRGRVESVLPSKILGAHIKLNRQKSLTAQLTSAVTSIPGIIEKSLEADYKKNLY